MKATAVAHPIQGIVKYHGLLDRERRIPYHDSISVCTAPTETKTTVEVTPHAGDIVRVAGEIDGVRIEGRAEERALSVVTPLLTRALGAHGADVHVVSRSNFPQLVGLGSSSSGFAALAKATAAAVALELPDENLSEYARLGAGSATRSLVGGFARWTTDLRTYRPGANGTCPSYGHQLAGPDDLEWATLALVVGPGTRTDDVHEAVRRSPYLERRVDMTRRRLRRAEHAIKDRDAVALMAIAEEDTLDLHAITLATPGAPMPWRGVTVEAMRVVRELRELEGIPVYFSVDTGATVYVNTLPEHYEAALGALGNVREWAAWAGYAAKILRLKPAGGAKVVSDHLF